MSPLRILLFGTHPNQYNGYSKVVYELICCLAKRPDVALTVYGFQKFQVLPGHREDVPANVELYDAFEHESPKGQGFGVSEVRAFVKENKPDVCIVYNDMMIIHQIVTQLKASQKEDGMNFKIIGYIDQVYLNQKKEFIDFVNTNIDFGLLFTKHWQDLIVDQGLTIPHDFLPHGFNPEIYYPIPKRLARAYHSIKMEDFVILNLNRNQPRKRWDICLKAFAEIVSRYPKEPIKMIIGTAVQGAWNLIEIFERELKKRNLTLADGMQHVIIMDRPQKMSDEETNIMYNIADIGWNTCDGEGFGLCNFEQAALGIPQVVPRLGGFIDFFDDTCAQLVEPKMSYYVDNSRDMVCGEALLCEYVDYVEAIETYYFNKEVRASHGKKARSNIMTNYAWPDIADKLYNVVYKVVGREPPTAAAATAAAAATTTSDNVSNLISEVEKIDIASLLSGITAKEESVVAVETIAAAAVETIEPAKASVTKPRLKNNKSKKNKIKKAEIRKLKEKLDQLLNDDSDSS